MATIRDTHRRNVWGEGNEKEVTFDNGDKYIIKNSHRRNVWGDGYEQEIVKTTSSTKIGEAAGPLFIILFGCGPIIFLMGLLLIFADGLKYVIGGALLTIAPVIIAIVGKNEKIVITLLIVIAIIDIIVLVNMFSSFF